jgi:hypothetical protein
MQWMTGFTEGACTPTTLARGSTVPGAKYSRPSLREMMHKASGD